MAMRAEAVTSESEAWGAPIHIRMSCAIDIRGHAATISSSTRWNSTITMRTGWSVTRPPTEASPMATTLREPFMS